ncbi:tripartite tricarboxylate transporter substrate binding protein [Variovorax sp. J22G21]|uniref:tripartite tricarboxylate transporter substrate binding protein n=1 Tax=Variovorax fucosicus TaxID=3053517 RepID=UPI002578A732|nr:MULTISPECIES: tripartite tricarboxylate transporter substrate binding protein [unclassified Variovorax]MDM0040255.1 tripartite tricarboxylate transporter substrate binding protein [Variovorax sp. J22R193]MDM0061628.1 tripartite tricarboxylate transporter substrate binding protein [Variovorax sp. J22G21]
MFIKPLALSLAVAAAFTAPLAQAQDKYPSKPVKIIVPYAPGGPNDIVARLVAQKLGEMEKQSFIVENKPGGGSNIGADFVAKAPADGYTLLIAATSHAINMTLFPKDQLKYDLLKDLTPVSMIMTGPLVVVTRPDFPANSLKELVAAAKAKPGELSFASSGNGSSTHLGGEMLNTAAGIKTIHVPYKGSGPGLTDVMGGQTTYMVDTMISATPFVTSGKLKALAVTGKKRSQVLPNVPTVAEQGYPNFEAVAFIGMMAPAATPKPIVDKINADLQKVLAMPDIKDKLAAQGFTAEWMKPADFGSYLQKEVPKWGAIVKSGNVKID